MIRVFRKIEVWWILNFELDGDPAWDGKEVDEDAVVPGPIMMLRMLLDAGLGNEEEAWAFYREFMRRSGKSPSAPGEGSEG